MNRKEQIIALLAERGPSRTEDIRLTIAPEMTRQAFWYNLKALQSDGFVTATGAGPSSRWTLEGPAVVRRHLETPPDRRPPVGYDISFLEDYVPNRTSYIGAGDRETLGNVGTPPPGRPGATDRRVLERYMIDLSWASSRLEGNTYSLLETERLVRFGEAAEGRTREETTMVLNHKRAVGHIRPDPDVPPVSAWTLRSVHALVSAELLPDPMWEGALRTHEVRIGGSAYMPPNDPHVIAQAFETLAEKAAAISDPFEQSFFLCVHVPLLQAFEDCNKRTSRVAASIPLLKAGLSPLSFFETRHRDYVDGLLGVYELGDISLAREVFVDSYLATADRYWFPTVSQGAVSRLAIEHRAFIERAVRQLVLEHGGFDRAAAETMCAREGVGERAKVVEAVRKAVEGLHEGNVVRYGLSPENLERLASQGGGGSGGTSGSQAGKKDGDRDWKPPEPSPL
ncbi:MAG: Fic family protein [Boseongicola sp. SB0673_bin_14]|nr:Fic family protein [Boseongicola sp. SB0667_bin_21]MYI67717.1 Fic family protein [Boseongicola sp. SB0673_bin_14]